MKIKRMYVACGLAILAGALLVGGVALARGGGGHGWGPEGFLRHLDHDVQALNLDQTQQQSYQDLRAKLEADFSTAATRRQAFVAALKTELGRDQLDWDTVSGLIKNQHESMGSDMDAHVQLFAGFYKTLTPAQQKTFRDHVISRLEAFPPRPHRP